MIKYFYCLILLYQPLYSLNEAIPITFQDLANENYNGRQVAIKGFLYKQSEDHWILASEPGLKSCCVGSKNKINTQIVISGNLPKQSLSSAVIVEGDLSINPNRVDVGRYEMSRVRIIENNEFPTVALLVGLAVVLAVIVATKVYHNQT